MVKVWYFEQSSPIRSDYFALNGYGIQEPMPPGIVNRPQGTGDFLLMYFFDPVDLIVDQAVQRAPGNTLMVWQPGSHQYYGNPAARYMHSWMHCNGQLVRHLVNAGGIALDHPIAGVTGAHFEHYLSSIHFECSHGGAPDTRIVENVLRNLLLDVARATGSGGQARSASPELLRARQFIEANYARRLTLPELASQANLSAPHFCTQFRRAFDAAPITYLVNYRMAQAAYLLLDRNARVGDVARRVGIDDVYYFSRLFKQRFGKSPRAMRDTRMERG